jgi:hypothetical protein
MGFFDTYTFHTSIHLLVICALADKYVKKYHTYDDVLDAVKAGQTIDTIMDARLCTWKGGKKPDDTEVRV